MNTNNPALNVRANISESNFPDTISLVARILLATIFVLAGASKLGDPAGTIGYIASTGMPVPEVGYLGAVAVELAGGILLIVGYQTRLVAAVLAAFSLVTAFLFHFELADQGQFINFFKNLAMAGGLLQILVSGPGRFAFDSK